MSLFGFFGGRERGGPGPEPMPQKESRPDAAVDTADDPAERNREIMLSALAERIFNEGMTADVPGDGDAKRAKAREMAADALSRVPDNYLSLPEAELRQNKTFLIDEALSRLREGVESFENDPIAEGKGAA